jgi:hypothetical protein
VEHWQGRCRDAAPLHFYPDTKQAPSAIESAWEPTVTTFNSGEYSMRSLSSKTMLAAAGLILCAAGSLAVAPPAQAQGQSSGVLTLPAASGPCPDGWETSWKTHGQNTCRAFGTINVPSVYVRPSQRADCASGYYVDRRNSRICTTREPPRARSAEPAADVPGGIARAGVLNRCPTGWRAASNNKQCFTEIKNAPTPRLKNGAPCAPGELDDWGIWCTSNYEHLSYAEVDLASVRDFNTIYANAMNDGLDYNSIPSGLSPDAKAFFKGANASPGAAAAEPSSASQPAATKAVECTTGSEVGAAIGGALGGRAGAALGGALGGLGKKKRKNGC